MKIPLTSPRITHYESPFSEPGIYIPGRFRSEAVSHRTTRYAHQSASRGCKFPGVPERGIIAPHHTLRIIILIFTLKVSAPVGSKNRHPKCAPAVTIAPFTGSTFGYTLRRPTGKILPRTTEYHHQSASRGFTSPRAPLVAWGNFS